MMLAMDSASVRFGFRSGANSPVPEARRNGSASSDTPRRSYDAIELGAGHFGWKPELPDCIRESHSVFSPCSDCLLFACLLTRACMPLRCKLRSG